MDRQATPPKPPDPADLLRRAQALTDSTAPATRALAQLLLRLGDEAERWRARP
ncbi:hypothetical protein [Niveispirillum sp.]|uniref:hypothetical protein n=1 Tax=Niveispirillum sp. TaxID=1917217 RepID=UPI001B5D2165|nr:hypothetical protein [Niveispirillum sp.]MBP7336893.1 hypothetical protein [Niveispirillum sp.]